VCHKSRAKGIPRPLNNLVAKPLTISLLDILPLKDRIKYFKDLSKLFLRKKNLFRLY